MRRVLAPALSCLLLASACAGTGAPPHAAVPAPVSLPKWRPVDANTGSIRDTDGLAALAQSFPDSGSVRLRLFNAQLADGDGAGMVATLRWLNERGYVFSETARGQIPKLIPEAFAKEATALLLPPADPVERSTIAWTLPAEAGLVESLLVDAGNNRMVATSISTRSVWGTTPNGGWQNVAPLDADNLSGITADESLEDVWVASGNVDQSDDDAPNFAGLMRAKQGSEASGVAAPAGVVLSDLHRADDGTIYASDPINGGVYRLGIDRRAIETVIAPGTLRSPQGLVTSADGSRLYVSDYRYGLAIVDLASGTVSRLASDIPVLLDGIDALLRRGNSLIAVQNGTSPMRMSQLYLSEDGARVIDHRVLEQAHREWTEPLGAYLGENALYYIGNGQWDKYVAGELGEGKQPEPTEVRLLPLD